MSEKLLSEYQCVLRELEMIKNRAAVIKDVTQDRLKCAKNDEEKENIFIDFKTQLHKIKKDKNIKHKYKNLVKRKEDIETELLVKMSEEKKHKKHIPSVKNSRPKPKPDQKPSKQHKVLSESSSSESEKCVDVNVNIDVGDDLASLINKYQQNITFDESSPKKHHKHDKHVKHNKHHRSECSESSDDNKNTTIIVNVPNNCNNNCSNNGGGSGGNNNDNCNKPKKNPYVDSESCSDDVKVQKKSYQPVKRCLDDTQQVKKLYNLIKDLQCEIDK